MSFEDTVEAPRILASCLRNGNTQTSIGARNRVSFPEDERDLVTGYLEPASPWDSVPVSPEDLVALYEDSCYKHATLPLEQVVDQLKGSLQTCPNLELSGALDLASLEALEAILRRVRFQTLRIKSSELGDDAAVALFDMLEYYESAATLSVTCDAGLGLRAWQACSRMIKKAHCLEELDVRGTPLNEQVMPVLCRSLKVGSKLTSLQLGRCGLSGRCMVVLVAALRLNTSLQELTLADNDLVPSDAVQLGSMLRVNNTLRFLDISNNYIQDAGCVHICDGVSEQHGEGLEALVLWNTHLTYNSAFHIASMLASSSPLETLNIGQNQIGSNGLAAMRCSMSVNRILKQLGVQAAHINCEGAAILADVLTENSVLRRIDARSNHIGLGGLTALKNALDGGANVQRIDLDDSQDQCQVMVEDIRELCRLNEARALVELELEELQQSRASNLSRKISLTCETLMIRSQLEANNNLLGEPKRGGRLRSPEPSPIPSPASSPVPSPSRHRFRVSRVSESESSDCSSPVSPASPVSSRFRVTVVEPPLTVPRVKFDNQEEGRADSADSADSVFEDNHSPPPPPAPAEPMVILAPQEPRRRKVPVTPVAPMPPVAPAPPVPAKSATSLEKLLGLFQNPTSLFSSVTLTGGDRQKHEVKLSQAEPLAAAQHDAPPGEDWDWGSQHPEEVSTGLLSESQSKNNNNM